jgi:hypothetical protein
VRLLAIACALGCAAFAAGALGQDCRPEPGTPHVTGIDSDGDGIADGSDNCPDCFNPSQHNTLGDAFGDACRPPAAAPSPGLQTRGREFQPTSSSHPRLFLRPYALGAVSGDGDHKYGSAGLHVHVAGAIDGWRPDPRRPEVELPPYWRYHAGVYGDLRVTSPQGGVDLGIDHRPLWWAWYARHLPELAMGLQAHLLHFDRSARDVRSPLALGVGLKLSYLEIVNLIPFAQTDLRNGGRWSWGAVLGFDVKIADDLGL